jgi:hypothetical protein
MKIKKIKKEQAINLHRFGKTRLKISVVIQFRNGGDNLWTSNTEISLNFTLIKTIKAFHSFEDYIHYPVFNFSADIKPLSFSSCPYLKLDVPLDFIKNQ